VRAAIVGMAKGTVKGRDVLACAGIEGVKAINLCELHRAHNRGQKDIEVRRAEDVFRALAEQGRDLREEVDPRSLLRAKLNVVFDDDKERVITIEPPNVAVFDRESDNAVIHEWLSSQGFICTEIKEDTAHAETDTVLAAH